MKKKQKKKKVKEKIIPVEQGGRYDGKPGYCFQRLDCGCGCSEIIRYANTVSCNCCCKIRLLDYGNWKP